MSYFYVEKVLVPAQQPQKQRAAYLQVRCPLASKCGFQQNLD
jgi:hypothetical protein